MHLPLARRASRRAAPRLRPRARGRLAFAVGFLAVALASPLPAPAPVSAQPNCISNLGYFFAGMHTGNRLDHNGNYWSGASALLVPRHGHICDFNPNFNDPNVTNAQANTNSGWSMLQGGGCQVCGYAQTGYYRGWGESTYFFFEYPLPEPT